MQKMYYNKILWYLTECPGLASQLKDKETMLSKYFHFHKNLKEDVYKKEEEEDDEDEDDE